jgi:hypothetical protein
MVMAVGLKIQALVVLGQLASAVGQAGGAFRETWVGGKGGRRKNPPCKVVMGQGGLAVVPRKVDRPPEGVGFDTEGGVLRATQVVRVEDGGGRDMENGMNYCAFHSNAAAVRRMKQGYG